jgi:hypothetical protein
MISEFGTRLGNLIARPDRRAWRELLFWDVAQRSMARHGIDLPLAPFGGAASPALLYLVLRALEDLPVRRVLECGAGQTTLLLDAWSRKVRPLEIVTLEDDPAWAGWIQDRVLHEIVAGPLVSNGQHGAGAAFYDTGAEALRGRRFDLIIIDGPRGRSSAGRRGAVTLVDWLAEDWFLILDDAERPRERQTVKALRSALQARAGKVFETTAKASRWQALFCSEGFQRARWFV